MKKTGFLSMMGIAFFLLSLFPAFLPDGRCEQAKKTYKVCLTQIVTHPALDEARRGFIAGMAEQGFKGVNVEYIMRNPEGDMHAAASIAKYFVSLKPDLIAPSSTPSSQAVVSAAKGTDIPIVFYLVTDPVSAGLVPSWTQAAPNVTGVSNKSDVHAQIKYIKDIMPKVKSVGILYNAGEVNSAVQRNEAVKVAAELGLKTIDASAAVTTDVYAAAKSLVGRADAMWMPTDNTIFAAVESVIKVAEENKIPFFGSDTLQANAGLAAAAGVDIFGIGHEGGTIAGKILKGEITFANTPTRVPMKMAFAVNLPAAQRMGLTIPQEIIAKANMVIK